MDVKLRIINNYYTIVKKGWEKMYSNMRKGLHIIFLILDCVLLFFCMSSKTTVMDYTLDITQFTFKITGILLLPYCLGILIALILSDYFHFSLLDNIKTKDNIRNLLTVVMIVPIALNVGFIIAWVFTLQLSSFLYNYLNFAQNNILFITTMYFILGFIFIQSSTKKN